MTLQDAMTLLESLQNANSDESDSDEDFMDDYLCTGEDYIPPPLDSSSESDSDTEPSSIIRKDPTPKPTSVPGDDGPSVISKDGTVWKQCSSSNVQGRMAAQNIVRIKPGPTSYAFRNIKSGSCDTAFKLLFDESMIRHIQKCTNAEGRRETNNESWNVSLEELEKFIGLIIYRGITGGRTRPLKKMWSNLWGEPLFPKTMSKNRFSEIMRYIRFDMKNERSTRLIDDKFCLASDIWNPFIENCQKSFVPGVNVTVDEQLLPCKARCKFIQYMANKPDKFGIKFWLLVDVDSKYLFNGYPYLGKDDTRNSNVSVSCN